MLDFGRVRLAVYESSHFISLTNNDLDAFTWCFFISVSDRRGQVVVITELFLSSLTVD